MAFKLGMNGKLYYSASPAGAAATFTTELKKVKDVDINMPKDDTDVTTRDNEGWHQTLSTLRNCEITFDMPIDTADAGYAAVRAAWLANGGTIGIAALTGPKDEAGTEGIVGDFTVSDFSIGQPLTEAQTAHVVLKIFKFKEWYVKGGAPT